MAANSFAAELTAVILPVKLERRQPELLPVQPNVRAELPAEAGNDWPRKDNDQDGLERPGVGCRSGSA